MMHRQILSPGKWWRLLWPGGRAFDRPPIHAKKGGKAPQPFPRSTHGVLDANTTSFTLR